MREIGGEPTLPPDPGRLARAIGAALFAVGAIVLVGWALDLEALRSFGADINVKASTAAGLLLSGFALALVRARSVAARIAGLAAGVLVALLGAATLSQHLAGWDLGIDQVL